MAKVSFNQETWFFVIHCDPASDAETVRGVCRWWTDGSGFHTQRWDRTTGAWVDDPGVVAASGIGGDSNFVPTTRQEAEAWIKEHGHAE